MICVTYLPLVGYTILLRDLLAPLLEVMLDRTLDGVARNLMVSLLVVLVSNPRLCRSAAKLKACSFMVAACRIP